jgi:hypothetical protein
VQEKQQELHQQLAQRRSLLLCAHVHAYSLKSLGGSSSGTRIGTGLMDRFMALLSTGVPQMCRSVSPGAHRAPLPVLYQQ